MCIGLGEETGLVNEGRISGELYIRGRWRVASMGLDLFVLHVSSLFSVGRGGVYIYELQRAQEHCNIIGKINPFSTLKNVSLVVRCLASP